MLPSSSLSLLRVLFPLLTIFIAPPVQADDDPLVTLEIPKTNCLFGCFDALDLLVYPDIPDDADYYAGRCHSELFTTSLVACISKYCTPAEIERGWIRITDYCLEYGDGAVIPYWRNIKGKINPDNITEIDTEEMKGSVVNDTVVPSEHPFQDGLHTENAWYWTHNNHHAFGWALYILFGLAILFGIFNRIVAIIINRSQLATMSTAMSLEDLNSLASRAPGRLGLIGRINTWLKRHVTTPALFGYKHSQPWGFVLLPTRLQTAFISGHILINFIFSVVGYDVFEGNMYWSDTATQICRYVADRTGIMCFYNLPILWLLGGRNNIFLWVTGWSYSTASLFHRYVAIVSTIQAIVHSICYTWLERETLAEEFKEEYWATGVVATILMSFMLPLSVYHFRQRFYETFLILHIVGALGVIIMLFYHVKIWDGDYNGWLWACVAVWTLDRLIRIFRFLILSYHSLAIGSKGNNATLSGTEAGAMRLTVRTTFKIRPSAGHYFFIYTPRSYLPWENHPFTLASWNAVESSNEKELECRSSRTELHFMIAPYAGGTRRLRRLLTTENGYSKDLRIMLEGPYGSHHQLRGFDQVLFVAGGSGITAILPYLDEFQKTMNDVRRLTVIWAVRSLDYAADIRARELSVLNGNTGIKILVKLFVTGVNEDPRPMESQSDIQDVIQDTSSSEAERSQGRTGNAYGESPLTEKKVSFTPSLTSSDRSSEKAPTTQIINGRPNMSQELATSIDQLIGSERLAVLSCGPASMMDDLRKAVSKSYGQDQGQVSGSRLEYFEDAFGW